MRRGSARRCWPRPLPGRITAARHHLAAASAAFEDAGGRGWAARADAELTAAGGTPATVSPRIGGRDELTPQELQIASLAAEGLTVLDEPADV
ncbi:hypothetical protein FRACA_340014 [Frankia canadensis]|uniref:Uncharacterized protein n=1 Tax=Frankia canadensis TaxID=1836972 RepID=A0A2I2KV15_9ACTN|nr:hypothetical protein FRACA_340014 [Frankia canadensis]SOU56794.1 hypothetical protein FRACA_340014 [Frankia canadensis]